MCDIIRVIDVGTFYDLQMEQISRKIIFLQKLVKNLAEILFVQIASGDIDRDRKAAKVKVSTLFQDPACFYPYVFIHLVDQSLFFNQGDELVWRDKSWNRHRFFRGPEVEEDRSQNMQRLLRAELGKNAVLPA